MNSINRERVSLSFAIVECSFDIDSAPSTIGYEKYIEANLSETRVAHQPNEIRRYQVQ